MTGFDQLEAWLGGLLVKTSPAARRTLARAIAAELRRRQAARIAGQHNPDGTPYAPRRPQLRHRSGRIRRAMFNRLRLAKWLRAESDPNAAVVTFVDSVQRIATVHHYGLRDRVNRNGLTAQYPARELLGLDDLDVEQVAELVLDWMNR